MSMTPTNTTLLKTKAENGYAEQFEAVVAGLPGDAAVRDVRTAAMARFKSLGLPHRRIEEWKYTDLRALIKDVTPTTAGGDAQTIAATYASVLKGVDAVTFVFVDGTLVLSPIVVLPGVTVESLASRLASSPDALTRAVPDGIDVGATSLIALNAALASSGAVISVADGVKPEIPLHLVFVSTGRSTVRNSIAIGVGAEATIIESHVSTASAVRNESAVCDLTVGRDAVLHHLVYANTQAGSAYLGTTLAVIDRGANYKPFQLTIGDGLVRQQLHVTFAGSHASFDHGAVTLARGGGHGDTTMVINHNVPHCVSRELFKTVLDDNARAVFQGKVIVAQAAQKTDGKQMARALMLSPNAEFDSKPELEIYADDVVCGHGSTCAEIDPDLMFYCRSRGIPEAQARALLIDSFVGEAIEKIDHAGVRRAFSEIAMGWLAQKVA